MYNDNNRTDRTNFSLSTLISLLNSFFCFVFTFRKTEKKYLDFGVCVVEYKIMFGILCNDQTTHRD